MLVLATRRPWAVCGRAAWRGGATLVGRVRQNRKDGLHDVVS